MCGATHISSNYIIAETRKAILHWHGYHGNDWGILESHRVDVEHGEMKMGKFKKGKGKVNLPISINWK